MKYVFFIVYALVSSIVIHAQNNNSSLTGFASIGLTDKATPIEVCKAIPAGTIWRANITKSLGWSGFHYFTGTVIGFKISKEKCIL